MAGLPQIRLRRLRNLPLLRDMVRETELSPNDFIYPLFVTYGRNIRTEIRPMPGCYQLSPDLLAGTATGVFVGIGANDYSKLSARHEQYFETIDPHVGTGNALSIAANRLSYILDFRGPSVAVDTACSSSSVGLHMAVQSLRGGAEGAASKAKAAVD